MLAYALNQVQIHDFIKVDIPGHGLVITTPGRLIFNYAIPEPLRFFYKRPDGKEGLGITIGKKQMGKLVNDCFKKLGFKETGDLLDSIKSLGFHYALFPAFLSAFMTWPYRKPKMISCPQVKRRLKKSRNISAAA